jgi:hypothetical protein
MMSFVGQRIVGGGTCRTVTLNSQLATPPQAFEAVQVTAEMPIGKHVPEGGMQPMSTPLFTAGSG